MIFNNGELARIEAMIDCVIRGETITESFDESRLSVIESKLFKFLKIKQIEGELLSREHDQIHRLIADISHQTKTPIANLKLYSEMLAESPLNIDQREKLAALHTQVDKLQFLVDAMVLGARLESGIIEVQPTRQSITPLMRAVAEQVKPLANTRSLSLEIQSYNQQCRFDYKWTNEALVNILDNAIKYSPPAKTIKFFSAETDLYCIFHIIDEGIGIEDEDVNRLFTRFYRGKNSRAIEGLGIGLYLAREIVTKQSGYIIARANHPHGSHFSIYLPK